MILFNLLKMIAKHHIHYVNLKLMENLNQQYQKLSPPQFLMKALLMQLLQPIRDRTCLNKSNHTDTQLNETSATICTPTSSDSTITGSKSIDARDYYKFNWQEYELKTVATSHEMKLK